MSDPNPDKEVLIPEVLPPERGGDNGAPPRERPAPSRSAFSPMLAGALIDVLAFFTLGLSGLILGFIAMFWIGGILKLPFLQRLLWSFAAAWYAAVPILPLPLGTLIGAYAQFIGSKSTRR